MGRSLIHICRGTLKPRVETKRARSARRPCAGTSLVEMVVTVGLMGTMLGMGVANFRDQINSKKSANEELLTAIRGIRWRAMATTSTYTVKPVSDTVIRAYPGTSCSAPLGAPDPAAEYTLSRGHLSETNWEFCFRSNGRTDSNLLLSVCDPDGTTHKLEVLLGGGTREVTE
jgi:type II secretory pathway pseudopilin PulG